VILGLRTDQGVATADVAGSRFRETIDWAQTNSLATHDPDGRIRLTTCGRLLSNEVFGRLV